AAAGRPDTALAEQPDFRREPSVPPIGRWCDAAGREVGFPGRIRAVAPRDPSPRARRQRLAEGADADGLLIGPPVATIARRRLLAIDAQARRAPEDRQRRRNPQRIRQL